MSELLRILPLDARKIRTFTLKHLTAITGKLNNGNLEEQYLLQFVQENGKDLGVSGRGKAYQRLIALSGQNSSGNLLNVIQKFKET